MSYSVVRKPKIIQSRTRAIVGDGNHDENRTMGTDGLEGQRVPAKEASAELAALEKLKCRHIGHVSITPSTVGDTLTQEEVRRRQQQDFNKAKMAQPELSGQQNPKN